MYFVRIYIFLREAILYMSVPDVMREGHNLNILSITVQNLHNVRVFVYCHQILRIYRPLVSDL
jgi:hypothetical protein